MPYLHDAPSPPPLRIIICGAGIAGLAAAVGLRQQGHHITILEKYSRLSTAGNAISLAPNATRVLRGLGLECADYHGVTLKSFNIFSADGIHRASFGRDILRNGEDTWDCVYRNDLKEALLAMAVAKDGQGVPVELRLGAEVLNLDADTGTVTLADGEKLVADVVVGADGSRSLSRAAISDIQLVKAGKAAFRANIPMNEVTEDEALQKRFSPDVANFVQTLGVEGRVYTYPCRDGTTLNLACYHDASEEETALLTDDWTTDGNKKALLARYSHFDDATRKLLSIIEPWTLKTFQLMDMPALPTFFKGRLALIGDAAHPFLPMAGLGGGTALEDAASLSVMLSSGARGEEVPARLELYNQARWQIATDKQTLSRSAAYDTMFFSRPENTQKYVKTIPHDEWAESRKRLEGWLQRVGDEET